MKVILCGGGTGGHVTPILAVAHEIKKQVPDASVIYIGEHGGKFGHLVKNQTSIDSTKTIFAGKFRRYYGESWLDRLKDIRTFALNVRDLFYTIIGFFQGLILIKKIKPDVIFIKGGIVGLPIGLAASLLKIPYVTHDSDSIPSLTYRIIGKKAIYNTLGTDSSEYGNSSKIRYVGVPVASEFQYVTEEIKNQYRREISVPSSEKMIFLAGGSLGASSINKSVDKIIHKLTDKYPDLYIVLQVGKNNLRDFSDLSDNPRISVYEFLQGLYKYSGAADIVLTRGGATNIAEFSLQGKPCVIIPNPILTGGHQTKNAQMLVSMNAARLISEDDLIRDPEILFNELNDLLINSTERTKLSDNIKKLGQSDAAKQIADLLVLVTELKH